MSGGDGGYIESKGSRRRGLFKRALSTNESTRHPFSLHDLFCLTTLVGVSVALVSNFAWTDHERWLLGLTLGGSLLGIAVAGLQTARLAGGGSGRNAWRRDRGWDHRKRLVCRT